MNITIDKYIQINMVKYIYKKLFEWSVYSLKTDI
jgi:hypothetical protein